MKKFCKAMVVIVIAFVITTSFLACKPAQTDENAASKLEYGFEFSNIPEPMDFCAFKSDSNQFDINNVSLDFYFGSSYIGEYNKDKYDWISIPEFDIYFTDILDNMLHLVRHVDENYITDKYKVNIDVTPKTHKYIVNYNHKENITIPSKLFTEKEGRLGFRLGGINVLSNNPHYYIFNGTWIYYKVNGTTVTLSGQEF